MDTTSTHSSETPKRDPHHRLLLALAMIGSSYGQAMRWKEKARQQAMQMHDDHGQKIEDPHDPNLKHHLLERRTAALLSGGRP